MVSRAIPAVRVDPTLPVLLRPDGTVQLGWDPRRAVVVRPPAGITADALAQTLRQNQANGIDARHLAAAPTELLDALVQAGVAQRTTPGNARTATLRLHGRGPLSDLLATSLRNSWTQVKRSTHTHLTVPDRDADLLVLADFQMADPRLVRDLHRVAMPHLLVRVRDGTGLIGPLVLPGLTSCLACADLHRSDRDQAWPTVAAQLREQVGSASPATVMATAAIALGQIDGVLHAIRGYPAATAAPVTLSATVEVAVDTVTTLTTRHWPAHPNCGCTTLPRANTRSSEGYVQTDITR